MTKTTRTIAAVSAAAGALFAAGAAHAGALYVPGYGPQAQGRAGAFLVKADDVSALAHNPAGLARAEGNMAQLGANFLRLSLSFQRAGHYPEAEGEPYEGEPYPEISDQSRPTFGFGGFQAVPVIGFVSDLGDPDLGLRIAGGLITPKGYPERRFAPDYEFEAEGVAPPPQRYDVMEQTALKAGPSIAAGYQVTDDLDVGARFTWGIARLEATSYVWGVNNYDEYISRDGVFEVDAWDYFVPNFGVGARYRPAAGWELGASYQSPAQADARGEGAAFLGEELGLPGQRDEIVPAHDNPLCAAGGEVDALKTCVDFKLPQVFGVGARRVWRDERGERADIELNVKWENWSSGTASDYELAVDGRSDLTGIRLQEQRLRHNFRDTYSFRLGGSYAFRAGRERDVIASAGAAYDTAAAPTQYNRLDIDGNARATLGVGLAYATSRMRLDFAGGAVLQPDRTVESCVTSAAAPSCDGSASPRTPVEREQPDPIQPLRDRDNQAQSPFNGGDYSSSYAMFSVGVTTWF